MNTKFCLGTAAIGRPVYINVRQTHADNTFNLDLFNAEGIKFLEEAYSLGIKHFDTAPSYGAAEQMLQEWLNVNKHPDVALSSKWGYSYEANFKSDAKIHENKEHSLQRLTTQWEETKKLLPHLKLYQIHSATIESTVLDNIEVLQKLNFIQNEFGVEIGVTVTGANQNEIIKKAITTSINGKQLFSSIQVTYNVFEQGLLEVSPLIKEHKMKLIVKESMANGRVFRNEQFNNNKKMYELMDKLSEKYNVSNDAIALRYVIDSVSPDILLLGAINKKQLISNLNCKNLSLTSDELAKINSLKNTSEAYWNERAHLTWN